MTGESLLLCGGTIHTMDAAETTTDAIRFRDGVVDAVGDAARAGDRSNVDVIDLDGRTVLPGFNDAHAHIISVGLALHETDLEAVDGSGEALEALAENAASTDAGDWVLGFGYDESTWSGDDQRYLTREELDAVSDDHPVAAQRVDGHTISLNSTGLERVDFEGVEHDLERDEHGEPTGVVVEDAAIRVKTATYPDREKARTVLEAYDVPEPRLRIEHAELATDDQIERVAALGIVASMQPNYLQWSEADGLYEARLGERWRRRNNRHRTVLEADVPLAFGSDKMPFGPLYGIHHAVNAPHDEQRLSVAEAVRAYTSGSAYAALAEDRKGTLETGMFADAVVLDSDPFEHPDEIADIDVLTTIVAGDIVYEESPSGEP
ncbi:amidohydrolase [Natronococcus sp.]|uniref:amidohydrolase n=1 Tax=Natronococcus sp. TaxID=35747 RepID=UPI003A4D32BC